MLWESRKQRTVRKHHSYSSLEPKQLLTTFTVDTAIDDGGLVPDGLVSFREAMIAAETNAAFGDAPAGSLQGDVIEFASSLVGELFEFDRGFSITENLTVRGTGIGMEVGNQVDRLFDIETNDEVRFTGLSIVGNRFHDGPGVSMSGGGTLRLTDISLIRLNGAVSVVDSSLRVVDSLFSSNALQFNNGGAISITGGDGRIVGSTFRSNSAGGRGGAISVSGGTHVVADSVFENNSVSSFGAPFPGSSGGAIDVEGSDTTLRVYGGSFIGNSANMGGAISSEGHLIVRNNAVFSGNSIDSNGTFVHGGAINSTGRLSMVDVLVQSNSSTELGGGVFHGQGSALLNRVRFVDNHANIFGGGLAIKDGNARLIDVVVEGNNSDWQGGGVHISNQIGQSIVQIDGGTIKENSAATLGGGLYAGRLSIPGIESSNVFVAIYGETEIADNTTDRPYEDGDTNVPAGGGIFSAANLLQINDASIVNNNSVGNGGGIHVESGRTRLGDSVIISNQAQRDGGGISISGGNVSLFRSAVGGDSPELGNRAGEFSEEGALGLGGGIYIGNEDGGSRLFMVGGLLANNVAKVAGGGLAANSASNFARIQNRVRVVANRALVEDGGGVYIDDDSHLESRDSIFEENSSRNGGGIFLNQGSANLSGTSVQFNRARRTGGGIFTRDFLSLEESLVSDNVATFFSNVFDEYGEGSAE